mmetsp:Transcript_141395/g.249801  ORF Transcript_141395/g.249801 Transcript_141395/m.249801 type:complete len:475 (+) Transcript_141395:102-1526(+)
MLEGTGDIAGPHVGLRSAEDVVVNFRSYPKRFHMLGIFVVLGFVNQMMYLTFASIPKQITRRYSISEGLVTAMAIECVVFYLPGSWITARVLATTDLRRCVLVGCALQVTGTFLRFVADAIFRPVSTQLAYAMLALGQGLAAIATPTFMNTPVVFAEAWFNEHQREGVVSVLTLAPLLGQGAGPAISGLMVTGDAGKGIESLLALQFGLAIILVIWAAVAFRSSPPTPPSRTAGKASVEAVQGHDTMKSDSPSTLATWASLFRRPQFLLILSIFVSGLGATTVLLTLFAKIIGNCGYSSAQAGLASGLFMLGGIFGALTSGAVMGTTRAYRPLLRITIACAVVSGTIFLLCLRPGQLTRLYALATLFGMCMLSAMPVLITNATEETFPIPSDASTSLLYVCAIIVQIPLTPLSEQILNLENGTCGGPASPFHILFYILAGVFALLPALAYRGKYHRLEFETARLREVSLQPGES